MIIGFHLSRRARGAVPVTSALALAAALAPVLSAVAVEKPAATPQVVKASITVTHASGAAAEPTVGSAGAPTATAAPNTPGALVSVVPARVLDTRTGLGAAARAVDAGQTVSVQVAGRSGVPATGVGGVLLTVTATNTSGTGYVTAYADGATRPDVTQLSFSPGRTVSNLIVVPASSAGAVTLFNGSNGSADLIADVSGYYVAGTASQPGAFTALTPARILDSRQGSGATGPVGAGQTVSVPVRGQGGVPTTGVSTVLLDLTATAASGPGSITAFPSGKARPATTNLSFTAGRTTTNLVAVPVGTQGQVSLYNRGSSTVQLIADVVGYVRSGTPVRSGMFAPVTSARLLDTTAGSGAVTSMQVGGMKGVAADATAVLFDVTVSRPRQAGHLIAYPAGTTRPDTSVLNFAAGQSVSGLVTVKIGPDGKVNLYNSSGANTRVLVDVAGYVVAGDSSPTGPVTGLVASAGADSVSLTWTDPSDPDLDRVMVRRQVGRTAPTSDTEGTLVSRPAAGVRTTTDRAVQAGTTYSYALFPVDNAGNVGPATTTTATVPVGPLGAVIKLGSVDWTKSSSYYGAPQYADPDVVDLFRDAAGRIGVATYHPSSKSVTVDKFDPTTRARVGATRTVSLADWPIWGGFYAAPDGSFFLTAGRNNPDEDDNMDVIVVQHYSAKWALLGSATVKGGVTHGGFPGVKEPFAVGAPSMVQVGNKLVLHMSRKMYADGSGATHQSNLSLEIDVPTMTASSFDSLGRSPYVSHSFRQLVTVNGTNLVFVDHGDMYPRGLQVNVMANYPTARVTKSTMVFPFNGSGFETHTTVTGLTSGTNGVVLVGNSIDHAGAPDGPWPPPVGTPRNIYTIGFDPATGASTRRWLTSVAPGEQVSEPRVVQLSADRAAVLFTVSTASGSRTEYRLIDSSGARLASASFPGLAFSAGSDPLLSNGRIYWPGRDSSATGYLFALDVTNPASPALTTG